ncbi:hypothetical protein DFH08DRAFT_821549 [Mycena albidolilacea]|uniref:Uncharacterized protein n=1 Tax=Mycena albidolilacea TaxID=1033008 RepID=A0AAD6Z9P1_9AGAR|nr:hypothetical protein DFH08DRAFT_821549 [Mycena albidolilacea]
MSFSKGGQWTPSESSAKSSGKHPKHTLSELAAVIQGDTRTQWRPLDSTGIMVVGSGGRHRPMPTSADEPVATSAYITATASLGTAHDGNAAESGRRVETGGTKKYTGIRRVKHRTVVTASNLPVVGHRGFEGL